MRNLINFARFVALAIAFSFGLAIAFKLLFALSWSFAAGVGVLVGGGLALFVGIVQESATKSVSKRIYIGKIPIPQSIECRHFLVAGTTGSGKSQAIFGMVSDARDRGDRGVVFDVGGAYAARFCRSGDLILSPGDARSVAWNPFLDLRTAFDYSNLARAVIPDGQGADASWHHYGQTLFAEVLRALHLDGDFSVARLLHLVSSADAAELKPLLSGSAAEILTKSGQEKMLGNTRAIIATYLLPWKMLPDAGDFSITDWIRGSPADQWIFIPYKDNQVASLRQLLSAWMHLAISETLSVDEREARQTWFIADEFDTLGKVAAAKDALTKLRKYRGSCIFGLQSISQLRATYGKDEAMTLLACLSSKIYLRQGDPETAKYCADDLGQHQIRRSETSTNKKSGLGGDDSETTAERHVTEHLVMASELQNLPDLKAFISLAGDYPVAKITIPIPTLKRIARPFVDET